MTPRAGPPGPVDGTCPPSRVGVRTMRRRRRGRRSGFCRADGPSSGRRREDLNLRGGFSPPTPLAGERIRPLCHVSSRSTSHGGKREGHTTGQHHLLTKRSGPRRRRMSGAGTPAPPPHAVRGRLCTSWWRLRPGTSSGLRHRSGTSDQRPSFSCSSAMCLGVPTRYLTKVRTPSASMANVERITPSTILPYMFFSPHAP